MTKHINDNPFELERLRLQAATKRNVNRFKSLYNTRYAEITNKNNSGMWNLKNTSERRQLGSSGIYSDKIRIISRFLSNKSGEMLDIGFGSGILEERLKNRSLRFYGIDIASKSAKKLAKLVKGTFKIGNISSIPFKSSMFDYVVALDILEHISPHNTFKALREINRVTKKGGHLLVSVPLNEDLEDMINMGVNPNAHVRSYSPEILRFELEISGFNIVSEQFLYAFQKNYTLRKFILKILPISVRKPNLYILFTRKL